MKQIINARPLSNQNGMINIVQDRAGYYVEYFENEEAHVVSDYYKDETLHEQKIQEISLLLCEN